MATAIISGRVDDAVKAKAAVYLKAAKVTPGEVIKIVWENIAATGKIPAAEPAGERQENACDRLIRLCDELPPSSELTSLTKQQMRDMIAEKYL